MPKLGFHMATFMSWWFALYIAVRIPAVFGQLYVFTRLDLSRTMTLFSAMSLVLVNMLGFLLFREILAPLAYAGIFLALTAFLLVAYAK